MPSKKLPPLGEKEHVVAARKKAAPKKPAAPRKRAVGKMKELAAPYGRGPHYKTPGICQATRNVVLGTTSGLTVATMYNFNPEAVKQAAAKMTKSLHAMADSFDKLPCINMRP